MLLSSVPTFQKQMDTVSEGTLIWKTVHDDKSPRRYAPYFIDLDLVGRGAARRLKSMSVAESFSSFYIRQGLEPFRGEVLIFVLGAFSHLIFSPFAKSLEEISHQGPERRSRKLSGSHYNAHTFPV